MDLISHYSDLPEDCPPHTDFVVDLAPFPAHFLPSGRAVFPKLNRKDAIRMEKRDFRPDTVVYATGYTQEFSFLGEDYPTPSVADIRNVCRSGDEDIAFIGFVRPGVGEFPSLVSIARMSSKLQIRRDPPHR